MPEIINSYSNGTEIKVAYSYGDPNIAGNYTPVTAELYVHRDGYGPSYDTYCTAYININGSRAMNYTSSFRIGADWVKIGDTVTVNVSHNEDGTKTCNITGYFHSSISSKLQNLSVSSDITLPSIARASAPSMSDFTIGNSVRIYTNRASSTFTHTITYTFGNSSRTIASGVENYFDWTTANDANALLSQVQGQSSGVGTITLYTYSGSTFIGSKPINFTAYVPALTTADDLSFNIGEKVTINLHRSSTLYTHSVDVICGSWRKNLLTGSTDSNCIWDTSADKGSLYAQMPLNTGNFKIRVSTYCGTLHIGDSDAKLKAAIVNGNPIFSDFTFQDTNPATVALTGNNQKLVCGQSKVAVTISAANKATSNTGATIKSYTVTCGEKPITVPFASGDVTVEIENASSGTIQVTATDSRSNQTVVSKQADFVNYTIPTITAPKLRRDNDIEPKTKLTVSGEFWNSNFGALANTLTLRYAYKSTSSDTWGTAYAISAVCDKDSFNFDTYIKGDLGVDGFSNDGSFDLIVYAQDNLSTVTTQTTLPRGIPLVDFERQGLGIGKLLEHGTLDVAGDIYSNGYNLSNPVPVMDIIDGNFQVNSIGSNGVWHTGYSYDIWDCWKLYMPNGNTAMAKEAISPLGSVAGSYYCAHLWWVATQSSSDNIILSTFLENGVRNLCSYPALAYSFWAKGDATGRKVNIKFIQNYGTGGSPSADDSQTQTITLTNSWTKYTVIFNPVSITSKTFGTNNNDYISISFISNGSINTSPSGGMYFTQVQLDIGNTALPYRVKSFDQELQRTLRYYEQSWRYGSIDQGSSVSAVLYALGGNLLAGMSGCSFAIEKRTQPTIICKTPAGTLNSICSWSMGSDISGTISSIYVGTRGIRGIWVTNGLNAGGIYATYWTADARY